MQRWLSVSEANVLKAKPEGRSAYPLLYATQSLFQSV
jgi:hypothetical protein